MSLLRRRMMVDIPKTEPKGNVVKVVLNVSVDDMGNAPIFDVGFDISQVKYIRLVDDDRELDIGYTLDLPAGDYKLEIGLNVLTNGDLMFYGINLLYCDFSDVDISNMYSARYMFAYTNIDKPPFLSLPDVTLTPNCFEGMFEGCASLIYAPILPSRTLVDGCYKNMFKECNSLIFVKALFNDNPYEVFPPPTEDWMLNVASEGTFVISKDASFSESEFRGVSGIPEGWTVVNDGEESGGGNDFGIEFPLYLEFDYCEENFLGSKTCERAADELGVKLYNCVKSIVDEYGEDVDLDIIIVSEQILDMLGIEIYIQNIKVINFSLEFSEYSLFLGDSYYYYSKIYSDGSLFTEG